MLNEIIEKGQKTIIKGNEYLETKAYCLPFLERMRKYTDMFDCFAICPQQLSIGPNGEPQMVYNKVHIEAILPGNNPDISEVIGFTYALDTRKPVARIYKAWKNNVSGSLMLNNSNYIINQTIEPETSLNFSGVQKLLETELDWDWIERLKSTCWEASNDQVNYKLGQWIRFAINFNVSDEYGKVKIATNDIIAGYKLLFEDSNSPFFTSLGIQCNFHKTLDALSSILYNSQKDPVNLIVKSYLLKDIISFQ
jgi:hypothetical protein